MIYDRADSLNDLVAARLRFVGQRYTSGKREIVGLLIEVGHPVSIGDIAERLPKMPRSSAYRHLVDLQQAGVVRRVTASDEFARFELAEDLTEHHHHLLCVHCGRVIDVKPGTGFEASLNRTVGQLARAEGFVPQSHRLDVFGICATCGRNSAFRS
ncbi:MAG: hypothetical protein EPN30_01175 [Actinomycetota bacterium]|nr:MAG: hypothetical protein EPN30_01175 [Actinomycetota bacterium]